MVKMIPIIINELKNLSDSPLPMYDAVHCRIAELEKIMAEEDIWMKQARKNNTCAVIGCKEKGFPYCDGHDAP